MKPTVFSLFLFFALLLGFSACKKETVPYYDPAKIAAEDEALIQEYLAKDSITNATRTSSGLYYAVLQPGTGQEVKAGNTVSVHYIGRFLNGQKFDSSYDRGEALEVTRVGSANVIKGWNEGLLLMKKGEKGVLYIPSALAYGPNGNSSIPSNTVLKFEITVLDVR